MDGSKDPIIRFNEELKLLIEKDFDNSRTTEYLKNAPTCVPGYEGFIKSTVLFDYFKELDAANKLCILEFVKHTFNSLNDRDQAVLAFWNSEQVKNFPNEFLDCNFYDTGTRASVIIEMFYKHGDGKDELNDFALLLMLNPITTMYVAIKMITDHPEWKFFFPFKKILSKFTFLEQPESETESPRKCRIFLAAFKLIMEENKGDGSVSAKLADILYLSTVDRVAYPLATPTEVLILSGQFINEGIQAYVYTIKRLFEEPRERIEWNLNADDYSNPYQFIPFLLEKFGKAQKKLDNVTISGWLSLMGGDFTDQGLNVTCTQAMRVIGGQQNWAFRYAAFHILNLHECKYEIPLSIYKTVPKDKINNFICIMNDEEPSYEKYLEYFFELVLIASTVPDELMVGITSTYPMEKDFLELVSKVGYYKIQKVKKYYKIDISKLFTSNVGRLYYALGNKLNQNPIFEQFCSISVQEMIDVQRILVLGEMMVHFMKDFEETNNRKFRLNKIDDDDVGRLFLQGFESETFDKIEDWKARLNYSGHNSREQEVSDVEFMSMLNGARKLMVQANRIYFAGQGFHQILKSVFLKLDDFLRRHETLSSEVREKLKDKPDGSNQRHQRRYPNNERPGHQNFRNYNN